MTRFGKISPLWQKIKVFGNLGEGLFSIRQNIEHCLANICCRYWQIFHCSKWPNIEQILQPSGHSDKCCCRSIKASYNFFLSLVIQKKLKYPYKRSNLRQCICTLTFLIFFNIDQNNKTRRYNYLLRAD